VGSAKSDTTRVVAAVSAVLIAVLGIAVWVGIASVKGVDRHGARLPMMAQAAPATYHPVEQQAAPVAQSAAQRMGKWTPMRGYRIAVRAYRWLNTPYSWAAGGPDGPSYGQAVDHDSRNDNHVYGFDCSGLTMYAIAPWKQLSHDAAAQYTEVGHFHPALNYLQPGDFVFWSKDGTINGIGHVAIYIGNGNVVQAPHSGDVVRVTPIYEVESGTMGATRPLT
jgi:cell wall-associated NlpC family hydrolase